MMGPDSPAAGLRALRRRILIVDDNIDGAETMRLLLEMGGHEVAVAYDGASALELAADFQPDVVLCDIGLPGISGLEVARQLRKLPNASRMTLVAVTGYGQDSDRAESSAAGFDHHLVKPVALDAISAILSGA